MYKVASEIRKFASGELNVTVGDIDGLVAAVKRGEEILISRRVITSDDLVSVLLEADAVKNIMRTSLPWAEIRLSLDLGYVPYSRQDRVCHPGEAHSLHVVANILNDVGFDSIYITDPHSTKAAWEIKAAEVESVADVFIKEHFFRDYCLGDVVLVAPDKGAKERVQGVVKAFSTLHKAVPALYCGKTREDKAAGAIVGIEIPRNSDVEGRDLLVVDDICDGGRTFIELAKALKERNPKSLRLYVTHGFFTYGLEELKKHYEEIYCCYLLNKDLASDKPNFLKVIREER